MPYIKKDDKRKYSLMNDAIWTQITQNIKSGELNYLITEMLLATEPRKYEDFNRLIGVLECVKQEFYRRAISKYEDEKIKENGDVY